MLSSTTVFNIDGNKKYFLSTKLAYSNDFYGSCDTENWCSYVAENSAVTS